MKVYSWFTVLFLMITSVSSGQNRTKPLNQRIDSLFPDNQRTYLVDEAHLVKDPAAVIARLREIRKQDNLNLVVVTLPTLGDRDIADVALEIGRKWLVALANDTLTSVVRNTGGVILFVPTTPGHGKCRVEVATGSEGYMTDNRAANACRDAAQLFHALDYDGALLSIANAFDSYHKESTTVPEAPTSSDTQPAPSSAESALWVVWLYLGGCSLVLIPFALVVWRRRRKDGMYPSTTSYTSDDYQGQSRYGSSESWEPSSPSTYTPPIVSTEDDSYRRSSSSSSDDQPSSGSSPSSDFSSGGSDSFSGGGGGSDI
jgi:uncharacterized membrane protein YgcG